MKRYGLYVLSLFASIFLLSACVDEQAVKSSTDVEEGREVNLSLPFVYEGAGYTQKGLYRPTTECRMKINEAPAFCPVCQRALERLINFYTAK